MMIATRCPVYEVRWLSGRKRRTRNAVCQQWYLGFESLTHLHRQKAPIGQKRCHRHTRQPVTGKNGNSWKSQPASISAGEHCEDIVLGYTSGKVADNDTSQSSMIISSCTRIEHWKPFRSGYPTLLSRKLLDSSTGTLIFHFFLMFSFSSVITTFHDLDFIV